MKALYISAFWGKWIFIILSGVTSYAFFYEWASTVFGSLVYAHTICICVAVVLALGSDLVCTAILDFSVKLLTKTESIKGSVFVRGGLYTLLVSLFVMSAYISTTSTIQGSIDIATDIKPPTLLNGIGAKPISENTDIAQTVTALTNQVLTRKTKREQDLESIQGEWAEKQLLSINAKKHKKADELTRGLVEAYTNERKAAAALFSQNMRTDSVSLSVNAELLSLYKAKIVRMNQFGYVGGWIFQLLAYFLQIIGTWMECVNKELLNNQLNTIAGSVKKIQDAILGVLVSILRIPEYALLSISWYLDRVSAKIETKSDEMKAEKSNYTPNASTPVKNENPFSNLIETVKIKGFELPKRLEREAKKILSKTVEQQKTFVVNSNRCENTEKGYPDKIILADFAAHLLNQTGEYQVNKNKFGKYSVYQTNQQEQQ